MLPTITRATPTLKMGSRSVRFHHSGRVIQNEILSNLSDGEFAVLEPHLKWVELPSHSVWHQSGEEIGSGFFLNNGITSLVVFTHDGRSVEVGIVGREGFVGTPLSAGLRRSPYRAIMQIPGSGFRVKSGILEDLLLVSPTLRSELGRYALRLDFKLPKLPRATGCTKSNNGWHVGC